METVTLILFIAGLAALVAGAELLVRGASRLAATVGISPLVIGLTVVAYGTSAPEAAVSVQSVLLGQGDIALGNAIGSNIFNVLFIVGLSALIMPLVVSKQLVWVDVPIMIGASVCLLLLSLDGRISRFDGALLFTGIVVYSAFSLYQSRRSGAGLRDAAGAGAGDASQSRVRGIVVQLAFIVIGLGALVLGARWLVDGALALARLLGLSELIIGLTIIAAGTSLPEVATSIVASLRGERDIAVGNVIGSCIFNVLLVIGLGGLVAPDGVRVPPATLYFDLPVMLAVSLACLPIFFTGHLIARWEGALFLGYYVAYVTYLFLDAVEHDRLSAFNSIMLLFVIPLTVVTLAVGLVRALRRQRGRSPTP